MHRECTVSSTAREGLIEGKMRKNRKKVRITLVQSGLDVLRKKSQIYLSMGVGVRVFWKGELRRETRE